MKIGFYVKDKARIEAGKELDALAEYAGVRCQISPGTHIDISIIDGGISLSLVSAEGANQFHLQPKAANAVEVVTSLCTRLKIRGEVPVEQREPEAPPEGMYLIHLGKAPKPLDWVWYGGHWKPFEDVKRFQLDPYTPVARAYYYYEACTKGEGEWIVLGKALDIRNLMALYAPMCGIIFSVNTQDKEEKTVATCVNGKWTEVG